MRAAEDEPAPARHATFIDIYYLHKEDHATPLARPCGRWPTWCGPGKIRHFGVSNHRSWRVAEICRLCDEAGIDRPVVSQPYYNAFNRMPETEHLPACAHYGLGVVPYSPARPRRADRQVRSGRPAAGRHPRRPPGHADDADGVAPGIPAHRPDLGEHAEARGITAGQFAAAWVLNNRAGHRRHRRAAHGGAVAATTSAPSTTPSPPRTRPWWTASLRPGIPRRPGYNDPAYPLEGRVPRGL